MAYAERVHLPVGIPLMTDAALLRTYAAFRRQLAALAAEGGPDVTRLRYQFEGALTAIEREFRMREIDPDEYRAFETDDADADVLRYVSIDAAF